MPCMIRSVVKTARFGAIASRLVGIASRRRLARIPTLRSMCGLNNPTTCDGHADRAGIDGKAHRSWRYAIVTCHGWQDCLCCEQIDDRQERSQADHHGSQHHAGRMILPLHHVRHYFRRHIGHRGSSCDRKGCDARACGANTALPGRHIPVTRHGGSTRYMLWSVGSLRTSPT